MHKKYQIGGSSSPLSSLIPLSSPYLEPNFENAFLFNFSALLQGNPMINNYTQDFRNNILPLIDQAKFQVGNLTKNSSDPLIALKGLTMVNDAVNGSNTSLIIPSAQGNIFSDNFSKSTFGKDFGLWSAGLDIANTAFTGLFGEKSEYSGQKGNVTRTLDSTYDSVLSLAGKLGAPGLLLSLGMGANKFLGNVANKLGAGTDGMCVCAGTKIFKANGEIVNVEDLKKEDGIIGWDENSKQIVPLLIHDFIEPRQKECLEIVLKNGYSIKCSIDHPILSDNNPKAKNRIINGKRIAIRPWEFRRADELKVGDFVGLANNIDYWGNTNVPNAYIAGLLIGDGSYGKGSSCRLISADPDTWRFLENNNLGVLNHCDDSRPEKYNKEIRTYRIIGGMELLHQLGIAYLTGKNKTLPKNIGKFDKVSVCNLLAGLFDTDGSISINEEKLNYSITLYLSNINLLEEVRIQLHKLGIFSTIGTRKAAKYELGGKIINSNESYRLEIHDISSAIKFYNLIPLNISYKKENLLRIYNMLKDKKVQEHNDISGAKQCKIVSITPIGIQTVYNLQADYSHTYLANCIITHNTTTDAILGSSFLLLTPLGLVNGFGGKKANTITKDQLAFETVGSSYTGSNLIVNDALLKSGKKYGLLSRSARKKANNLIEEAKRLQAIISDIAEEATDRFNIRNSMAAINGNNYALLLQGGYELRAVRVGRRGLKVESVTKAKEILSKYKLLQTNLLLLGGTLDPFEHYLSTLPENQRDSTNFRVKDYWIFNGKPKDFKEARRRGMFTLEKDGWHAHTIAWNPKTGEGEFMKSPDHPSIQLEIDWYNSDKGAGFRSEYELVKSSPYWKYVKRQRKEVPSHKDGGTFIEISTETSIELVDPTSIPEFLNGGPIDNSTIKSRTLAELIDYAKKVNPRFILRMSEPLKYVEWDDENGHHFGTHELGYTEIDGKYFIYPNILETSNGDLIRYPSDKWKEAVDNAYKNKNGLFFNTEEEAKLFTESGKNPDGTFYGYKLGWPEFFKLDLINKHLKGGSINVIPDGALHARKHNMEMDGITRKGIPVVSESNGEIELQAEVEKEELILRLEVTLKLEELEKKFYSDESTQEEKDECALEAGKLLVNEILYNTLDNTNNLL